MEAKEREPVRIPIVAILKKIPGGKIIIPLIIGSLIVTICSACGVNDPWGQVGSPSQILFSSTGITIVLGFMLFFTGTQIDIRKMKPMLGRGFPLMVFRLGIAYALSLLYFKIANVDGWLKISFVALTACLCCTNAGMFMGLVNDYGDDADYSYFGLLLLTALPTFPMMLIQSSTGGSIDYMSMISILLPFFFGLLLGNIDPNIRKAFKHGNDVVIPFLGFQFGSAINLVVAVTMIPQGLILIACWYILGVIPSYLIERGIMRRPGYISIGSSAMAGVALSIPPLALKEGIITAEQNSNALAMLALVLVVTSVLCPLLTDFNNKKYYIKHKEYCMNKFPSFAKHMDKVIVASDANNQERRVRKARKIVYKDNLSKLSDEERKEYLNNVKLAKQEEKVKLREQFKKLSIEEKRNYLKEMKIKKEDEFLVFQKVCLLMAEKKEKDILEVKAMDEETLYQELDNYKLLDYDREKIHKYLVKIHNKTDEKEIPEFKELTKVDKAKRTMEEYDEAYNEFVAIETIDLNTDEFIIDN